jgi:hypothetical protein
VHIFKITISTDGRKARYESLSSMSYTFFVRYADITSNEQKIRAPNHGMCKNCVRNRAE